MQLGLNKQLQPTDRQQCFIQSPMQLGHCSKLTSAMVVSIIAVQLSAYANTQLTVRFLDVGPV